MGDAPFNGAGSRRPTAFPALEQHGVDEIPGHRDGGNDHCQRADAALPVRAVWLKSQPLQKAALAFVQLMGR
jgi:hypothetical protein